jgi:hypothetical protein
MNEIDSTSQTSDFTAGADGWINDGEGGAYRGGLTLGLDPDDRSQWLVTDAASGEHIGGPILEDDAGAGHGYDLPLLDRLEEARVDTTGLREWAEWAEATAIAAKGPAIPGGRLKLLDLGAPALQNLILKQSTYMWLDTADPTLVALATAVSAADDEGEPLWSMIVGPSSGGKGERLRIIDGSVHRRIKDLTLAGLLSLQNMGKNKGYKPTGILNEIGSDPALVSITDFSAFLSADKQSGGQKMEIFNALRDIYDGEYDRTMHGGTAHWEGRLTFLAACTSAIDTFSAHSDSLGTRWLYYRLAELNDDDRRTVAKLVTTRGDDLKKGRAEASELADEIIAAGQKKVGSVVLDRELDDVITECALLASYGRSSVPREVYGSHHEISGVPEMEEPGRITHQLRRLAKGLVAIGAKREVVERILRHASVSSIPRARGMALVALWNAEDRISTRNLATAIGLNWKVAYRAAEDLEAVGIATSDSIDLAEGKTERRWSISSERLQMLTAALGERQPATNP